ncbi:hypothetical protein CDAR_541211 [Caerostris darwini]|uniref:Uncharacterized protein n=1 Tax=Caerostris darwini TaxID=1538125 RepID=A0AAV4WB18_9ARAC|nr:hypothetical protein CDAR_541211 [Caerostris darwini]
MYPDNSFCKIDMDQILSVALMIEKFKNLKRFWGMAQDETALDQSRPNRCKCGGSLSKRRMVIGLMDFASAHLTDTSLRIREKRSYSILPSCISSLNFRNSPLERK